MSSQDQIELVDDESVGDQLSSIENKLSSLLTKLNQTSEQKFELIDRNDLKNKVHTITESLVQKNFTIIKKYLQSKSSPSLIPIQETCVRLLTLCIQHSFDLAKQISSEFNYFNETKNWLEKFLLIKKSDLREMSLEFILSYLNYVQPPFNSQHNLVLIKKIFLKSDSKTPLTLINCLFSHVTSDQKASLDFMFNQLLCGVVRNANFSKTDKIRLFSDHILSKITKLFDYENEDETITAQVQQMLIKFYTSLFTSTKLGISFHDKSMGLKSDKNLNHLIFNQLIAFDFNKMYPISNVSELLTSTLKHCPDLVQRFIKVKLKQLGTDNCLFLRFLDDFFRQQAINIKWFARYLSGNEDENFLLELIVATSIPLGLNFHKELSQQKLALLTTSLNCVREWKRLIENENEWTESMRAIMQKCDCFLTKLNVELLSKYLPKFEQLAKNFHLITAYLRIFQQSLNLMDLELIEMDLSVKFEPDEASGYLDFVQCVTEIKYMNNFDMASDKLRPVLVKNLKQLIPRSDLMVQLVRFFRLMLKPSEIEFDDDLMYLFLRQMQKSGMDKCDELLEAILCQKKRSVILLDQTGEIRLDQFLALIGQSSDLMFSSSLLSGNIDIDTARAAQEMIGKKVHFGAEKIKIRCLSQAFMCQMRELLDLESADLNIKLFNLSIRSRLLISLLAQVLQKSDGFEYETDFGVIMTNLENSVQTVNELSKDSLLSKDQVSKLSLIITTILKSKTIIKASFENESLSQFVIKSLQSTALDRANVIEPYVTEYMNSSTNHQSFILELDLIKPQFDSVMTKLIQQYDLDKSDIKINKKFFKNFIKFLAKNKTNLIDLVGVKYLDKIGKFDGNLSIFLDAFRLIFLAIKSKQELLTEEVTDLLSYARSFEPTLFDLQLKLINDDNLTNLVKKSVEPVTTSQILHTSSANVNELIEEYNHTLAQKDLEIFYKLNQLDSQLNCLLFSRASLVHKSNDLEQKQAKMSDFITLKIEETIMINTVRNFPIRRKIDEKFEDFDPTIYDPVYLLPNLYDLLNYANVVDVLQFIQSKCLALLLSSLSSHCTKIRMLAYGSLYRFVSHLENSRVYCKNIVLYLLSLIRHSVYKPNQRLSSVISVFLAESVSIIIEPGQTLYKPLVSFYLLKPIFDLANVPEFYKFFNSSSLEFKEERKWIMSILVNGVRSSLEYRLCEKRFVYRQLLSIYDSKLSDFHLKDSILNLLIKTCDSKYAVIDLVKKHSLLIWLSSVLDSILVDGTRLSLFVKMVKIFNKVWDQLKCDNEDEQLPLGFLNQMLAVSKIIKFKLAKSDYEFEDFFKLDSSQNDERMVLESFFRSSEKVIVEIRKYNIEDWQELNLNEIIDLIELKISNREIENYSDFVNFVLSRKRKNDSLSQCVKIKKVKI